MKVNKDMFLQTYHQYPSKHPGDGKGLVPRMLMSLRSPATGSLHGATMFLKTEGKKLGGGQNKETRPVPTTLCSRA